MVKTPEDWREACLVRLPERGELLENEHYEGVVVLSVREKILSRVILERCHWRTAGGINRSFTDLVVTLCIVVERGIEMSSLLCIGFVVYEKAFDSIDVESLK